LRLRLVGVGLRYTLHPIEPSGPLWICNSPKNFRDLTQVLVLMDELEQAWKEEARSNNDSILSFSWKNWRTRTNLRYDGRCRGPEFGQAREEYCHRCRNVINLTVTL
jgi:hypothetical protein